MSLANDGLSGTTCEESGKRVCKQCHTSKVIDEFELQWRNGRSYRRSICNKCKNRRDYVRIKSSPAKYGAKKSRNKLASQDPTRRHQYALWNACRFDRDHGLANDLNEEFVRECIKSGCSS
jgi:hypothetical protein